MIKSAKISRTITVIAVAVLFISSIVFTAMPHKSVLAQAEETTVQAKTAAKTTDVTTKDSFLLGGYESYYPHNAPNGQSVRSHAEQTATLADLGLNFAFIPYRWTDWSTFFCSLEDKEYWETEYDVVWDDSYEAESFWKNIDDTYRENNMVYLMDSQRVYYPEKTDILVDWAKNLTNCIGYHVADEPRPEKFDYWGEIVREYLQKDPDRYPIVNMFPHVPQFGMEYRDFLQAWVDAAGAENLSYLSHDIYPVTTGGYRGDFYGMLEDMRYIAYENGKLRTHAYPQACQWNGTRMPNSNELRWNVYSYIAYGFKALSYFNIVTPCGNTYFDEETFNAVNVEGYTTAIVHWDGTIPDREVYDSFKELNWEIRAMGDILMNLDTAHAYHTLRNTSSVEYLPNNYPIQPKGNEDLVISEMFAKDGTESHIMILNKSQSKSESPSFKISSRDIEGLQWFNPSTEQYENVTVNNDEFSVDLRPGEGKLFRVVGSLHGESVSHAPRIRPLSGEYNESQTVTIDLPAGITADDGAEIRYTLDGSIPTAESPLYTGSFTFPIKAGGLQKYYLRAAVVQNGVVGDSAYREYTLSAYDGYDLKMKEESADGFTSSGGTFTDSNGIYELNSYNTDTPSYTYNTLLGKAFVTESRLCIVSAQGAAGMRLQNAISDPSLTVDIFADTSGAIKLYTDGKLTAEGELPAVDYADFKLKVLRYFSDITVYADDTEVLKAYVPEADDDGLYASVASYKSLFAAKEWQARSFTPDYVKANRNIVSIHSINTVTVELYVPKAEVTAILPETVMCVLDEGYLYSASVMWDSPFYDRTQSGGQLFYGTIDLEQVSSVVNSGDLQAQVSVFVRYDLDVWELRRLMSIVDSLDKDDFTEESWKAVESAYKSAQTLITERNDAQQGVEPIRRVLQSAINALVNPSINWGAYNRVLAMCENIEPDGYTAQSFAVFNETLQEVKALSVTGPYGDDEAANRTKRLNDAVKSLVECGDPAELNAKISAAREVSADDYSLSSYARFIAAVEEAESLVESGNATEEELEYACKSIDAAQAALCAPASITEAKKSGCGSFAYGSTAVIAAALLGAAIIAAETRKSRKKA